MSIRNFDALFAPRSIALVGASPKPGSLGAVVRERLASGGFDGALHLVNPRYDTIGDRPCAPSATAIGAPVDLGIVIAPARVVPEVIADLGAAGARAAIVITAGVTGPLRDAMLAAARPHCLRILGPNCIGFQQPARGIDASFAHLMARPGNLALLSQSGAIVAAMLDWAEGRGIGFSTVASLGDMADIDLGDMLDHLAGDRATDAILMYIEHVTHARKFLSAARRAARSKPVIAIKAGRSPGAARAAMSHTGALAGSDAVYDAALRRAGILRVDGLEELFDAAAMLARSRPLASDRLGVLTNGGGAGVLAADAVAEEGVRLADLGGDTLLALDHALPQIWSHANPVDIIGDAPGERYADALAAMLTDEDTDAVLVMNCPTALASSAEAARAVAAVECARPATERLEKPLLATWLGGATAGPASRLLEEADIATFATPRHAVRGFSYLTRDAAAQRQLMRTPPSVPDTAAPDREGVRAILAAVLAEGRDILTEPEANAVLAAYGIPTVPIRVATDTASAKNAALSLQQDGAAGFVVKILSRDITHKSDVGGVRLALASPEDVAQATRAMLADMARRAPDARIDGVVVQPMVTRRGAAELILGLSEDRVFGPVVLFGAGGTSVEVVDDKALALPPLDTLLAGDMIGATRIGRVLGGYRDVPAVDADGIARALVALSTLAADFPEIRELDINPLLADAQDVIALDARVVLAPAERVAPGGNPRFAIRPYPSEWVQTVPVEGGAVALRPIRPDDEAGYIDMIAHLTPQDIHFRFFAAIRNPGHQQVARMTQIDYAREIAFVAMDGTEMVGVSRFASDPEHERAEFAVLVRSDRQGRGIGRALMQRLIDYAKADGLGELYGSVMDDNGAMRALALDLGFVETDDPDDRYLQRFTMALR